jgi:hypothetical protein
MANKPNENFKLNTKDIELIETALYLLQATVDEKTKYEIQDIRAKIFHQKNWYRPKKHYVSG